MGSQIEFTTRVVGANDPPQDCVSVVHRDGIDVVVLADGAGNSRRAWAAAGAVIDVVESGPSEKWVAIDEHGLTRLFDEIDKKLVSLNSGESTGVVCVLRGDEIIGASVGDSGAWVIGAREYHDLTSKQRRKPLLGSGEATAIPFRHHWPDGQLLVASDGLLKYTQPALICDTVRSVPIETVGDRLLKLVQLRSGAYQDDVAIAVCRKSLG